MQQPDRFENLLSSHEIQALVEQLWKCEYYWTFNIFNSCTAALNLQGPWIYTKQAYETSQFKSKIQKMSSIKRQATLISQNSIPQRTKRLSKFVSNFSKMSMFKKNSIIKQDSVRRQTELSTKLLTQIGKNSTDQDEYSQLNKILNFKFEKPFDFIQITENKNCMTVNHIFSYFFWSRSPSIRIIQETLVYAICFYFIVENSFYLFKMRRIFNMFDYDILQCVDNFYALKHQASTTAWFKTLMFNKCSKFKFLPNPSNPNPSSADLALNKQSYMYFMGCLLQQSNSLKTLANQPDKCKMILFYFPGFISQCDLYNESAEGTWTAIDKYLLYQYFFFFAYFGTILEILYAWIIQRKIILNFKIIIDQIIILTNIVILVNYYKNVKMLFLLLRHNMLGELQLVESYQMVFIFMMWMKFLVYLKLTKRFGFMIKIIEIMIQDSLQFFIIFGIVILAFASIMSHLFYNSNPDKFGTIATSVRTLILFSFGQIDHSGYSNQEALASVITIVFGIISVVLLLNLLIAILSNIFSTINRRGTLETSQILFSNYTNRKFNKYYSSMIMVPPPLNAIIFPFIPIIILFKSESFNLKLMKFLYLPYYLLYNCLYIAINLTTILPICWIKFQFILYINIVIRKFSYNGLLYSIMWTFTGYFYLLYIFFVNDLQLFQFSLWNEYNKKPELDDISVSEINVIMRQAQILIEQGLRNITPKEFSNLIKQDLELINKKKRAASISIISDDNTKQNSGKNLIDITKEQNLQRQLEKNLMRDVELDKMEVFSFIQQYVGLDELIHLERLIELFKVLEFNKKNVITQKRTLKQQKKQVKSLQVMDSIGIERGIVNIYAKIIQGQEYQQILTENNPTYQNQIQNNIQEIDQQLMKISTQNSSQNLSNSNSNSYISEQEDQDDVLIQIQKI